MILFVKHTKYSPLQMFFDMEPEEWKREWAKFSPSEKEQMLRDYVREKP